MIKFVINPQRFSEKLQIKQEIVVDFIPIMVYFDHI